MAKSVDVLFVSAFYETDLWDNDPAPGLSVGPSVVPGKHQLTESVVIDGRVMDMPRFLSWVRYGHLGEFERYEALSSTQLSGAYYQSLLHRHGYTVHVANLVHRDSLPGLARAVDPAFVLVSTSFARGYEPQLRATRALREAFPDAALVLGGQFLTRLANDRAKEHLPDVLKTFGADAYVVSAYGETALLEILKRGTRAKLRTGPRLPATYVQDGQTMRLPLETPEPALPFDAHYVRWQSHVEADLIYPLVNTRTARSCAFACAFCSYPVNEGPLTLMDFGAIEQELQAMAATGRIRAIAFSDDTFNVPVPRFQDLLKVLARYDFEWYSYFRCQFADAETVRLMKESGCRGVYLGIEAADDVILQNMNKAVTVEKYRRGIALLQEHDILVHASFILGFPGETTETALKIPAFVDSTGCDFFHVHPWEYMSHSPIAQRKDEFGIKGHWYNWRHDTMTSAEASDLALRLRQMTTRAVFAPGDHGAASGWSQFLLMANGWSNDDVRLAYRAYARHLGTAVSAETVRQSPEYGPLLGLLRRTAFAEPCNGCFVPSWEDRRPETAPAPVSVP